MVKDIKITLSKFQKKFLDMADEPIVILTTGVGAGKSRVAALWVVMEAAKKKTRIIAAAQNYRALAEVLFREIEKLLCEFDIKYDYIKGKKFILANGSEIFGTTAENPTSILGFTDIEAAIIDEAAYCPEELYNYITDRMRGENIKQGKIRLISSPSSQVKYRWFKDLCKKYSDKVIHATTFDNPFTSEEYKKSQIEKYGKGTPLYNQQILGQFIDESSINCILRNCDYPTIKKPPMGIHTMGIDCAGSGGDYNVFVVADNSSILEIVREQVADTYKLYNIANQLIQKYDIRRVNVDATGGFGNGIVDMLHHNKIGLIVNPINFGQKPKEDIYVNARAEMYFNLANKIREGFYIEDYKVKEELQYTTYQINGSGKTLLVPKDNIRELIGHSPDTSDALALALYNTNADYISPEESLNIAMKFVTI